MTRKLFLLVCLCAMNISLSAQLQKPLPSIHVEGKWLTDSHGNHVVLHGVMDTPNAWFNGGRWGWDYSSVNPCLNYFEKLFTGMEKANCDVFRLHMDPAWTNDPKKQSDGKESGEADISRFSSTRLKNYLKTLYFPLAKKAMKHGMYVVVRPPGVCPGNIQVGDYYNEYLMTVWDIFTQNDSIKKYAGQISIELANEPVSVKNAKGEEDVAALHDFFQPIVDKIRANGFTGVIWAPGTGWQSNYVSYATCPIEGYNIGYAVHDYCGWYGCSDDTPSPEAKIAQFKKQVPVVDTNPIIITEVDWSPVNTEAEGHYNEHGDWVQPNYGTWATGSTSKWGKAFKAMLDFYGNISMTLSGTGVLIDIDKLIEDGSVTPAFNGMEEACGKACMDWYEEYYKTDWAHKDFTTQSISDLGNGKYKNPIIFADFPDPDVIRVGDVYYMATTTMHHFPGCTILKSHDLVNWEYCAQPLEQLSNSDRYNLTNGQNAYAAGMWACSMTYHDGKFYILINGNDAGGFILTANDPEGTWEKKKLSRIYYDPGMLFDNGKLYIVCGNTNIQMCELDEDFQLKQEKTVFSANDMLEGCHLYKINDYYYIYGTYGGWPSAQTVLRSKDIFGPYEEKLLVEKTINGKPNTVHQGALFDTPNGEWWTIMQEDLGAMGRMPNLQPVKWADGWPIVGNNGVPYTIYKKPDTGSSYPRTALPTNDNFRTYPLGMQWEWNHNPDNGKWTLFERPGWLRLYSSDNTEKLTQAKNMLTQRIFAYHGKTQQASKGTVRVDIRNLHDGDRAGICILQDPYAAIAVEKNDGETRIVWWQDQLTENDGFSPEQEFVVSDIDSVIYLRASITYGTSKTQFYYSTDNITYKALGSQTSLKYNLSVFVGARFGLFCYNNRQNTEEEKSYADFDWFSTEEKYDENTFYPESFEGYNEDMLTAESIEFTNDNMELMLGNGVPLSLIATYADGHKEDISSRAKYSIENEELVSINNGNIYGQKEGDTNITATFTDIMGNIHQRTLSAHVTFFPFSNEHINTSLFSQGSYDETTHTFRPGQWGQMGWEYTNGADMSGYRYLVIKLKKAQTCGAHINIFTANSIWSDCYSSADFNSKKQIVVDLQNATYTSGSKKGQKLETNNIHIVCFWGNGNGTILVEDMYLTNNRDYSREETTDIDIVNSADVSTHQIYTLSGQRIWSSTSRSQPASALPKGVYIMDGKKIFIK